MLREAGIEMPRAISVVGYDDIEFDAAVTPKLSTVTQPMQAMGAAAARLLLQRLQEPEGLRRQSSCEDVWSSANRPLRQRPDLVAVPHVRLSSCARLTI
jgi:DNA-binding LacI/PurR family transcriptional regulator